MSFFSWNIGQLSLTKKDLFRAWLHQQPTDCACLQDTGWQFTGEWQNQPFSYLHSGPHNHQGGLLTIVRAWTTPMDSRIQHVRLYKHTYNIDILNLYQFPYDTADPDSGLQRSSFWTTLEYTLKALPKRNCWILGGDFNTSLMHQVNCVGLSDFATPMGRSKGTNHKDAHRLQQLLKDFSMVALNTWTPDLPATYRGPRHASSRIDFVLIQQRDGDPAAKYVSYLQDLPQMMGLHFHEDHQPLLCGIPWRRSCCNMENGAGLEVTSFIYTLRGSTIIQNTWDSVQKTDPPISLGKGHSGLASMLYLISAP